MKRRLEPEETKARIIRAAGEVFGQHGFHGTTIRQITKRARVNVAAVNYHFRDKAELYLRVLREAKTCAREMGKLELVGSPEERLRAFIAGFMRQMLDPERPLWHVQVITQEMMHPTPALDVLVRELTGPIFHLARELVSDAAGTRLTGTQLDLLASSIMGQCLFYVRSRPMIERLAPQLSRGPNHIERIADHIATFSLAALCHLYSKPSRRVRLPVPALS